MTQSARFAPLLSRLAEPLTLVDVGARWGVQERWSVLGDQGRTVGFEPDAEECARLSERAEPGTVYLPFALSDRAETRTLHVTAEPACSSIHPPEAALYNHYPTLDIIRPATTFEVECRRLDDVLDEMKIPKVSALKLDTQGSELAILRGAEETLKQVSLIDVEVSFNPLYAGQDLFCDLDRYLRDQGFVLWRLEHLAHYAPEAVSAAGFSFMVSTEPAGLSTLSAGNGQVFWSQAQYVRKDYPRTGAEQMDPAQAVPAAVLAGVYGFWDLALELVRKTGDQVLLNDLRSALAV